MTPETAPREPEPHEFMPDDFFKEVRREDIFPGDQPLEVDLGCGDGKFLLEMAEHYPERHFLGVERLLGRVRKVCKKCKAPHQPTETQLRALGITPEQMANADFQMGKGCSTCNNTGYKGRFGLFEVFVLNDDSRRLIFDNATSTQLRKHARQCGMRTLREDGARKVLAGMTTAEAVMRATVTDGV